ncbi:MAG: 23S rRNA (adenine(2030)-N(6))-methyltransferase RlmJ [Pseudomonadota bacterium]
MLSYQHIYHAGNFADVHKHAILAWCLQYMTAKEKPLSYIETHSGRALYRLTDQAALKTGEAAGGIYRLAASFDADHPYRRVLAKIRKDHGADAYPGSPLIAASLLRDIDKMSLAELHPGEYAALVAAMSAFDARCQRQDGFEMAHAVTPPTPKRGFLLIDPSYEIKSDYQKISRDIAKITIAWNVGVIALWYPILAKPAHNAMCDALSKAYPDALRHEVKHRPVRANHGMVGSGMFIINPPFGLDEEAQRIKQIFETAENKD